MMMIRRALLMLIFCALSQWSHAGEAVVADKIKANKGIVDAITNVIKSQEAAWNRGDLDTYMQGYWQSEQMRFVTNSRFRFGWEETLALYKKHYPDADALGKLVFTIEDTVVLSTEAAMVVGRWELVREKDNPKGVFTLLVERKHNRWVITHDHTSE